MEPKTKLHHHVLKLFNRRPMLSATKTKWAKKRLFRRYYFETKHNLTCMECGHRWDKIEPVHGRYCKCPKCNLFLEKWKRNHRTSKDHDIFMVIEMIKGFQVSRYYTITRYMKVLKPATYVITEVVNQWLSPEGKMTPFARLTTYNWYGTGWSDGSSFEIRKEDRHYINCITYPKQSIHPYVYRNGYDGNDHGFHIMYLSKILLAYSAAETLLKTGKWDLFDNFNRYEKQYNLYWPSMLIAWRHKFDFEDDLKFWFDHMELLTFFKKDLHNPLFICSSNMKKEHTKLSNRRTKIWKIQAAERKRKNEEEELRRVELLNNNFQKNFAKYFDLKFDLDEVTEIVVLKDIDDFIEEGDALHHCVGSYFGKENSLIFSTRHKGKRIETVQFDLIDMEIKQSRGACNEDSPYHEQVIDTLTMNTNLIKSI